MTATGTSPRRSSVSGSSASNCSRRLAVARPAVPPPTMATPTSMRSSSSSTVRLMNSCCGSTGGGYAAGTTLPLPFEPAMALALAGLHRLGQLRQDLVEVADDAEVGELEDRGVGVLVDGHDVLRGLHADLVLDRAGDARREVELRRDGLARLADLRRVGVPAGVDHGARGGDRGVVAEGLGQVVAELEALGLAEAATAGDEDARALDVDVGAALLAARDDGRLLRVRRPLGRHVLDRGVAGAGLLDLERVEAGDDDALALVARGGDRRVAQDRALGGQLAVDDVDAGDLHRHAGVDARGQAGADLEAEQAAAEDGVLVAAAVEELAQDVDDRAREALGALGLEDLLGAVAAQRGGQLVADALADDDGVGLAAQLVREARGLRDGAERVLVEGALVVERVDQDVAHRCGSPISASVGARQGACARRATRRSWPRCHPCPRPR